MVAAAAVRLKSRQVHQAKPFIRAAPQALQQQQQQQKGVVCLVAWLLHLLPCSCWQQHFPGQLLLEVPLLLGRWLLLLVLVLVVVLLLLVLVAALFLAAHLSM